MARTCTFPLVTSRSLGTGCSYAYPLDDCDEWYDDITGAVEDFCAEMDITLVDWQPYLPPVNP